MKNKYDELNALDVELQTARKIFWLLTNDYIFLSSFNDCTGTWDEGAYPAINCNDAFVPGADAEALKGSDLDLFIEVMKKYPDIGTLAWCASKTNSKLWRTCQDPVWLDKYNSAVIGITAMIKERDDNEKC